MCKNKTGKRSANYTLPNIGQDAIPLSHFPTRHQAFIFRAYEYVPVEKLAKILNTDVYTVRNAAIGYEAANHYYFSKGQIAEKIINCHYIIDAFSKK